MYRARPAKEAGSTFFAPLNNIRFGLTGLLT